MGVTYFSGLYRFLSFDSLKHAHHELQAYVGAHPILTPFLFIAIYIASTALSVPGGVFLSLIGGFLFPQPLSTLYVLIGATIGATLLFLAAKTALGESLYKKAGPLLKKLKTGFHKNVASYLLFLRFVPLFPFWLVNLAPAFFNVRLWTYVWTTFVGILPGAFVFTQAGRGLSAVFEAQGELSLNAIFNTQIKIALLCLAFFALIPVLIKKLKRK